MAAVVPTSALASRARILLLAVAALLVAAGVPLLAGDARLALLSAAAVLGWTRLVGL